MSQIHYQKERSTLAELVAGITGNEEAVIVSGPLETKVYRRVVFPRETHWRTGAGQSEDVYEEFATVYQVVDTFPSGTLKPGDRLWAWRAPAYSLEDMRRYHEEGLSRSPVVRVREPVFAVESDRLIIVMSRLRKKETDAFPLVCLVRAEEGMGAEPELRRLLAAHLKRRR